MRRKGFFAAAVALAATGVLISSAGASSRSAGKMQVDLSSRAAVAGYLRSLGIDPAGVVVQRGRLNYAGSRCPGKAWACTTARRVVQISTNGANKFECTGTGSAEAETCMV